MNILRAILIGLASFVYVIAISGFVYLLTINTTVLDRTVVKTWLNDSHIYDGRLISALVTAPAIESGQTSGSPSVPAKISASPEALKTALNATFTPDFTQTQIEGVVNNTYNWIDGTATEFKFSIPLDQKRDTLIAQLAKAIEPQIAALPVCRSVQPAQQSSCRPPNLSPGQLATQMTTQSIDDSGGFSAPLTNASFSKNTQASAQPSSDATLARLPAIKKGIDTLLIILPFVILASIVTIIAATARGRRLAAGTRLSRRVFFGMLFILIPAIAVIWLAKENDFGLASILPAQTATFLIPLIKTIAVGVLSKLALISGVTAGIGVLCWIGLTLWRKSKPEYVQPAIQPLPQPVTQPTVQQPFPPTPQTQLPYREDDPTL